MKNRFKQYWVVFVACSSLIILTVLHSCKFGIHFYDSTHEDWGLFGDYLGGTVGAIFGLISIIYVVKSISIQSDETKEASKDERKKRNLDLLFNQMNNWRLLVSQVTVNEIRYKIANNQSHQEWLTVQGPEAFKSLYENHFVQKYYEVLKEENDFNFYIKNLDDKFKRMLIKYASYERTGLSQYDLLMDYCQSGEIFKFVEFHRTSAYDPLIEFIYVCDKNKDNDAIKNRIRIAYKNFYEERGYLLGHYFRNLFYVMNTIVKLNFEFEKDFLFNMLRSYLSSYELVMMYYNYYSNLCGDEYRGLIDIHRILKDLELQKFIHKDFVHKLALRS